MRTVFLFAILSAVTTVWHFAVLYRLMAYRKDLLENSVGLERFRSFISQSWIENSAPRNYVEGGHTYLKWYRVSSIACWFAAAGLVFSAVASTL